MSPRVHNIVSYAGALGVMPAVALWSTGAAWVPPAESLPSNAAFGQQLLIALWVVHFCRRLYEVIWVHRYSKPTFPWGDALVEYAYYWGFGAWIGYASAHSAAPSSLWPLGAAIFCLAEVGNLRAHQVLRALRKADPQARVIPDAFLFRWVSCPHYLCEILSWVGFALVAQSWAAYTFTAVGSAILVSWATVRHKAYRRDFDGADGRALYPAARKALLPFVY